MHVNGRPAGLERVLAILGLHNSNDLAIMSFGNLWKNLSSQKTCLSKHIVRTKQERERERERERCGVEGSSSSTTCSLFENLVPAESFIHNRQPARAVKKPGLETSFLHKLVY